MLKACRGINKMVSARLSRPMLSCPLTPCSVNSDLHDSATVDITYSTAQVYHEAWSLRKQTALAGDEIQELSSPHLKLAVYISFLRLP